MLANDGTVGVTEAITFTLNWSTRPDPSLANIDHYFHLKRYGSLINIYHSDYYYFHYPSFALETNIKTNTAKAALTFLPGRSFISNV